MFLISFEFENSQMAMGVVKLSVLLCTKNSYSILLYSSGAFNFVFLDFWYQEVPLSLHLLWRSSLCSFWSRISTFALGPIIFLLFTDIVPEITLLSPTLLKFPFLTQSFPSSCEQAALSHILTKTQNSCSSLAIFLLPTMAKALKSCLYLLYSIATLHFVLNPLQ